VKAPAGIGVSGSTAVKPDRLCLRYFFF
jgi:hypothetical protein